MDLPQNRLDRGLGIILRLVDALAHGAAGKAGDEAIAAEGVGEIGVDIGELLRFQTQLPPAPQQESGDQQGKEALPGQAGLLVGPESPEGDEGDEQRGRYPRQDHLPGAEIDLQHRPHTAEKLEIHHGQRRGAVVQDDAVHHPQPQPHQGEHPPGKGPPPEKQRRTEGEKQNETPEAEGIGVGPDEPEHFEDTVPVERFHRAVQHQRRQ